jgi:beta-N-acetylhexosaminidase
LGLPPLLIATDQEGGQLMAVGASTPLPGNMALGATGSEALARRAGEVLGCEMAALGVNVDYAPCVDVNSNPRNPVVGVRSFGEDPNLAARLGAAMVAGIQSQGVAATAKHFPGHGDTASDSHHGLPVVPHSLERLRVMEFVPFRACVEAGTKLVMTAHLGLPAIDGPDAPPATLSANVLKGILRRVIGFEGVIVTDALDMHAIRQGEALGGEAVRAANAGADLLLVTANPQDQRCVHAALTRAAQRSAIDVVELMASVQRVVELKAWLKKAGQMPELSVIASAEHLRVAQEIAQESITLVRDQSNLLPLRLRAEERIAVILPKPLDLTPADTSSYVTPKLAEALRLYHAGVDEFIVPHAPAAGDIDAIMQLLPQYGLIIIGTLNAFDQPGQSALVRTVLASGVRTLVLALRLPYDLAAFPEAPVYLCTYSLLEPSMRAVAAAIFGHGGMPGRLPVAIPGLYQSGFSFHR